MRPVKGDIMGTGRRSLTGALGVALIAGSLSGIAGSAGAATGPKHGGSITYSVEAETPGYCLPGASQLAPGGIEVASAIYDTLTTINTKNQYVPYLAQSVTPNATLDQWTITLRPNVKFQNGEALDANAVKLNLDTYRGQNPKVPAPLSTFTFKNVDTVDVTGPLTVVVKTKTPWPAFPAYLYGSGRTGIVAPAQLADNNTCATNLIGTGPFKLAPGGYRLNESTTVVRNPNYWRPGLPYLDSIKFVPAQESAQQLNGLQAGDFDIIQTRDAHNIIQLRQRKASGQISEQDTDNGTDVGYGMLNVGALPFNDMNARLAVAYAGDANQINQIRNQGLETLATGPFAPGTPYYLTFAQAGLPVHNVAKAKMYARLYSQAHGGQTLTYTYLTPGADPTLLALAELTKQQDAQAGINVNIQQVDQATGISNAIAHQFQFLAWANHPQADPDTQYSWWYSGSPVNFGQINDPVINQLLDQGRTEADPAKRIQIYKQLNKQFATKLYNLWAFYTKWSVGAQKNIGGLNGAPLPDGHGQAYALFEGIVPTVTLYKK
jgi:peptide/nickel transport system substrate-binding protein